MMQPSNSSKDSYASAAALDMTILAATNLRLATPTSALYCTLTDTSKMHVTTPVSHGISPEWKFTVPNLSTNQSVTIEVFDLNTKSVLGGALITLTGNVDFWFTLYDGNANHAGDIHLLIQDAGSAPPAYQSMPTPALQPTPASGFVPMPTSVYAKPAPATSYAAPPPNNFSASPPPSSYIPPPSASSSSNNPKRPGLTTSTGKPLLQSGAFQAGAGTALAVTLLGGGLLKSGVAAFGGVKAQQYLKNKKKKKK